MSTDAPKADAAPESKSFFQEFQEFIARGNAIDLAVGLVMGAAFTKVVTSIVNDLVMPPLGYLIGGVDFSELKIFIQRQSVDAAGKVTPEVAIRFGAFLNIVIEFFIIAIAVFLAVKFVNAVRAYELPYLRAKEELAVDEAKKEEKK